MFAKEDQEVIRFWGYLVKLLPWQCFENIVGINVVGVLQPWPMHGFSPNFQDMFNQEDLEPVRFWGVYGYRSCHSNTFKIFESLTLWLFHILNHAWIFTKFSEYVQTKRT